MLFYHHFLGGINVLDSTLLNFCAYLDSVHFSYCMDGRKSTSRCGALW